MKKLGKVIAFAAVGCAFMFTLAGCTRLAEQSKIYFDSIQNVLDNKKEYDEAMGGGGNKNENTLATPTVSVKDGKYSFNSVENASYYVISVYETSGALTPVGSTTIQENGSETYSGNMTDLKSEYSYQDWYVRVVAYPAEDSTLEESNAGFTTYTVKGAVTNGTITSDYLWNVHSGELTITLGGFNYENTAYPTDVEVTLTNKSTNKVVDTIDTGKLTSSSVEVTTELDVEDAEYSVSLDCKWDEKYVTNPTWSTTAEDISVSATRNIISDGASYTSGIFNQFEFPFVSEGFKPADVPTNKSYADVADEEGIVFGTSASGNNQFTFKAYPLWTEKGYKAKEGATYSFDVRITGTSAITATPKNSPGSASTNIIFGQLDFFDDNTFELEIEYQYIRTDAMNAGVYYVPGVICEGYYYVESDGTYTLSFDSTSAYETEYEPVEELNGRASYYSEINPDWNNSGGNQGGGPGGNPGGGDFVFAFDTYTWNTSENSFQLVAGSHALLSFTANKNAISTEGSTYSFTLVTNDTGAPFAIDCTLELKIDGTAVFHCGASGPLSDTTQIGTWTEADGVVTINLK